MNRLICRSIYNSQEKIDIQQVKEHHEGRIAKLQELIEERRQTIEHHESGHKTLSQEEYEQASRQHVNFKRKLEQMKESNHHVSFDSFR